MKSVLNEYTIGHMKITEWSDGRFTLYASAFDLVGEPITESYASTLIHTEDRERETRNGSAEFDRRIDNLIRTIQSTDEVLNKQEELAEQFGGLTLDSPSEKRGNASAELKAMAIKGRAEFAAKWADEQLKAAQG